MSTLEDRLLGLGRREEADTSAEVRERERNARRRQEKVQILFSILAFFLYFVCSPRAPFTPFTPFLLVQIKITVVYVSSVSSRVCVCVRVFYL